jgi:hypothetical protein
MKGEFENGRQYYQFHGKDLSFLEMDKPDARFLE